MEKKEFALEQEKLKETCHIIQEELTEEKQSLEDLYNNFVGELEDLWRMAYFKKVHIQSLEAAEDKPYFARVDYITEDGENHTIYIGKNGVMQGTKPIVTDWRAPVSSLYYDNELGNCSYISPNGQVDVEMTKKRQYDIDHGELLEYFDVDFVSNDSLLQKYLSTNNDARLKSIVATIQKEQNDVIRRKLSENIMVQGVAGSGKTTVALHRIAYLVYNYRDKVKQSDYLVIGPNPVFLKYIETVLPDLDVAGVSQCTFEKFAKDYIGEDFTINPSDKKVLNSINGKSKDTDHFKCSMSYKDMLDKFLKVYLYSLTSKPLMIGDFEVLSKEEIQEAFQEMNDKTNIPLGNRIMQTMNRLERIIEDRNEEIMSAYNNFSFTEFKKCTTEEERNRVREKSAKDRAEISRNCRSTIKKYFGKVLTNPSKLYKVFLSSIEDYDVHKYSHLSALKKETLKNVKKNTYDFEDLAALIYIKTVLDPDKDYNRVKQVVIDEAQDLGEFDFYVLKKALPTAAFSIFGDLAQSIYDYRGINNWDEVNETMFDNQGSILEFNKSYRTTQEIMSAADDVAESIGLKRSELVVRHGKPIEVVGSDEKDIPLHIAEKIREYQEKGYESIAIISKTDLLSRYINDDLQDLGIHIPNVSANDDLKDKQFKVCTISNQLAKGLEFDAVIINNASEDIYSSKSSLDMKLLYVAITRALHELDIVFSGELTKPLQGQLERSKEKIKA